MLLMQKAHANKFKGSTMQNKTKIVYRQLSLDEVQDVKLIYYTTRFAPIIKNTRATMKWTKALFFPASKMFCVLSSEMQHSLTKALIETKTHSQALQYHPLGKECFLCFTQQRA